jgi:hypothetical protein
VLFEDQGIQGTHHPGSASRFRRVLQYTRCLMADHWCLAGLQLPPCLQELQLTEALQRVF